TDFLNGGLGREYASEGGSAERRMRIGVSGSPRMEAIARCLVGHHLLRVTGHRVVLRVAAEYRAALPPRGSEGGRHATRPLLDGNPFRSQQIAIGLCRLVFPPRGLGVLPDLQVPVGEPAGLLVDPLKRETLLVSESGHDRLPPSLLVTCRPNIPARGRPLASLPDSVIRIVWSSDIGSASVEVPK